jgi:hypothetical protein
MMVRSALGQNLRLDARQCSDFLLSRDWLWNTHVHFVTVEIRPQGGVTMTESGKVIASRGPCEPSCSFGEDWADG